MSHGRETQVSDDALLISRELLGLSKDPAIDSGELNLAFKSVTETLARALGVARASIWLYNSDRTAIDCVDLCAGNSHSSGLKLHAENFPAYFSYLTEERILAAHDAHTDAATSEFSEVYLRPLGINSMLDAPIRLNGKMIGVICNEHVGPAREWTVAEETFVGNVADILARAFQAQERLAAQRSLQKINEHLELLVRERTHQLEELHAKTVQTTKLAALGEMAGGIAHEINTPLSLILILADQIQDTLESDAPHHIHEAKKAADTISQTVLRISKIIKGLKTFARDGSSSEMESSSLVDVAEQTVQLCSQRMLGHSIDFQFLKPAQGNVFAICRSVEISQVLLNLLNNAFDAVQDQNNPWIKLEMRETPEVVAFEVSNSGPLIPEHIRAKLFQPFFTTKPPGKGTGLGLSISKGIVDQHHGRFFIAENSPVTKFVVELPRAA